MVKILSISLQRVTAVTAPKSTKNMGGGQENTKRNNLKSKRIWTQHQSVTLT